MSGQLKDRKRLELKNFLGVDFASSPLNVAVNRASRARNFIHESGVNRKRNGWSEILKFSDGGNDKRINGIWSLQAGGETRVIVHAGTNFYSVDLDSGEQTEINLPDGNAVADDRSFGVVSGDKLYILCGDYLVYGKRGGEWTLNRVEDDAETFIPTTTISIDADAETGDRRQTLDDVNVLTKYRKNKFTGYENPTNDATTRTYTVDSKRIDPGGSITLEIEARKVQQDDYGNNYELIETNTYEGEYIDSTPEGSQLAPQYVFSMTDGSPAAVAMCSTGKLFLYFTYGDDGQPNGGPAMDAKSTNGKDNITLTFPCKAKDAAGADIGDYAERVTECGIGALFGVGGNSNRLFLSGNPAYPNVCFYSEENDFTYFSDMNTIAAGNAGSPITAFSRLGDGTLALHKRYTGQEASIYYLSGIMQDVFRDEYNADDEYLGQKKIAEKGVFPIKAGAVGEGAVSKYANVNLDGDNLFLSGNGVYGITLANNVATDERYARERSGLVNSSLTKQDLKNAAGIVYKNRYYLSADNVCYVADARFKTYASESGSYNYEWWYWDNIPARVWAVINDKLWFGTAGGILCVFGNEYADKHFEYVEAGALTFTGQIEAENAGVNNRFTISNEYVEALKKSRGIIIEGVNLTEAPTSGNEAIGIPAGTTAVAPDPYADELYIDDIQTDETGETPVTTFRVKKNGKIMVAADDGSDESPESISAKLVIADNVTAEWYTPVMDFGTNEYAKTLIGLTVALETERSGSVRFGYTTLKTERLLSATGAKLWDFGDLDFNTFSFDPSVFQRSYNIRLRERNFNYIMFRFVSDSDRDCAVNSLNVVYKINRLNRGEK